MAAGILLAALRAVLVFLLLVLLEGLAERVKDYYKSRKPPNDQLKAILKPEGTPTTHLIQARAIPNERLKRAFHLTNAFVSADSAIRRGFIEEASLIIKIPHQIVTDKAYTACTVILAGPSAHDFAACTQMITLHSILDLLDADIHILTARDLHVVAFGINALWDQSKTGDPNPAILTTINAHLARWLPDTPFNTPLDIIIPMWETLWRVVAITLAYIHEDSAKVAAFAELFEDPVQDVFSRPHSVGEGGASLEAIILEVLRLHPPTNNIARAEEDGSIVKACVTAAHRDQSVWGERADEFDPSRFSEPDHPPIYSFGYGPLTCIARKWAPVTAAVIVSAILRTADEQGFKIIPGPHIGGRSGWDGWVLSL